VESNDLIHATRDFIAIHAGSDGTKRIALPERSDVLDPWTREREFEDVVEFSFQISRGATRVWLLAASNADH
jgi:hypothetical protein